MQQQQQSLQICSTTFAISTTGGDCKKFISIHPVPSGLRRSPRTNLPVEALPLPFPPPCSIPFPPPSGAYCLPQPQFLLILSIAIVNLFIKKTLHKFCHPPLPSLLCPATLLLALHSPPPFRRFFFAQPPFRRRVFVISLINLALFINCQQHPQPQFAFVCQSLTPSPCLLLCPSDKAADPAPLQKQEVKKSRAA